MIKELYEMNNAYEKPELGVREYARFENVYANCDYADASACRSNPGKGGKIETGDGTTGGGMDHAFGSSYS
jgi:hypothetical protein